jgi:hypothetical protein
MLGLLSAALHTVRSSCLLENPLGYRSPIDYERDTRGSLAAKPTCLLNRGSSLLLPLQAWGGHRGLACEGS